MTDELKIKLVELALDRIEIKTCAYFGQGETKYQILHNEPSDVVFKAIRVTNLYFRPCKNHLNLYLRALQEGWDLQWEALR